MVNTAGSVWTRWDLHVHSPESKLHMNYKFNNSEESEAYNNSIWEKYITQLENCDPSISTVAITDYCTIDGYEKVLEYKEQGRLSNLALILANVEFRMVPVTAKNNPINVHCIFSDKLTPLEIKRFLGELKFQYNNRNFKCSKEELIELGRTFNPDLTSENDCYREGINQFKVNVAELRQLIDDEERYKDKVFIVVSDSSHDGASGLRENSTASIRQQIYRNADFIFSGNENNRNYFLGKGVDSEDEIIRKYGSLKPCIHGSDAHDFDRLFNPDLLRYCWIKAEPTFEGLRQILYEPQARIFIGKDKPNTRKNIYSLSSYSMNETKVNKELKLSGTYLNLNHNLVAIIGGKGSGKTAMIDLIANCYPEYDRSRHYDARGKATKDNEDKNSFVQRIEKECPNLSVELGFIDDQITFTKKLTENNFFDKGQLRYLPQGKIEEIAGNTEALHKDIQHLIFNHADQNEGEINAYNEISKKIRIVNKEINDLLADLSNLIQETSPELMHDLQRQLEIKKGDLRDRENKLQFYEGELTKEEQEASNNATNEIQQLSQKVLLSSDYVRTAEELLDEIQSLQKNLNSQIELINHQKLEPDMKNVPLINLSEIIDALNFNKNYATIRKGHYEEEKIKHEEVLKAFTGKQSEQASLLKDKDLITSEIKKLTDQLEVYFKKIEIYKQTEAELYSKHSELLELYKSQKNSYNRIIEQYQQVDVEILSGIDFQAEIYFDENKFVELAYELFDGRRISSEFVDNLIKEIQKGLVSGENITFPDIQSNTNSFRKNKTIIDYYKWLTQDYYRLDTKIYFNGTELSKLSVGQKGAVILKLYLADGDYPIILDQPEDNLDNRFISEELITAFRKAKEKRQIIIATHNANLVVNSDAEQIIVAEFDDNCIYYKSGSIENVEIRREVASLLEGGEAAFKQRENKYGFSRI